MRTPCCLVLVAASRMAAASGTPTIDAHDLAFGLVNNGSSAVRYIDVANDNPSAALVVTAAQFGDNTAGWFSFAGNGCAGSQSTCTLAPPLTITDHAELVAIRCSPPASSSGTQVTTVIFTSNTGDASHAIATVTCSSGGGVIEVTPATHVLDFGPVDLDRQPTSVVSVVRLRNTGTATVNTSAGATGGPDLARFGFSSLSARAIPPNTSFDITVTYTPVAERTAGDSDVATLSIPVSGAVGATSIDVTLRGHGVDRHAAIAAVPAFDATFLEPGPQAPVLPVTIANTGEAVLGLSHATITGAPTWAIINPDPVDVPGNSTYDVLVRFAPREVGPAPDAMFSIATSDNASPILTATITGSGAERAVTLGPASIDMYFAGVGTTAYLSDGTRGELLRATNSDPIHDFAIRHISVLGGENAFVVEDTTGVIAAGTTRTFDITFTPQHAGAYDATAVLFLDANTIPQASVALHGEGVYVGAVGGGGCSAAGDASLGAVLLVLAFVVRRRRYAALLLAWTGAANADTRNLDLAVFDPTPSTTSPTFQLQSADAGREGDWSASALATYANEPLVLVTAPNNNVSVADRMTLALGGAFAFGDRFEIALHMPVYLQSGENLNSATMFGEPPGAGTVRGDLTLNAKARLFRHRGPSATLVVGTGLALGLPTATNEQFAGSGKPQVRALALVSLTPAAFDHELDLTANAGAVLRATADFHDVHQGSGLAWGFGGSYHVRPTLALAAELFGELVPGGLRNTMGSTRALDTVEVLGGLHYQMDRRVNVGVAFGRGLTTGIGAPALRGILTVTFSPTAPPSIGTRYVAGDHDRDGIPDDIDKCPDEAEDKDGFEDEDGCPDFDNDQDGIVDAKDKCPNVAEDRDGFEDEDGCPDPDNDHDGIPDRFDHCPNQPETINGIDDEDGCPDVGEGLVKLAGDHVDIGEPIKFWTTGKIAPESFNVLGQLGATLRAHTELAKIRIVAHTLAPHAQSIVDWLVQYGIAASRLEASFVSDGSVDEHIDVLVSQ